ncbi:Mannose-6-phosphate isomerase [Nowakowskiella sp. JEL0407]|nr:Mannose-6-phosphate isomerase [Nowakowskiella sp. JEL0407]
MVVSKIYGKTQSYDWGKIGSSSKVAQLSKNIPGFAVDESKPYAELWMGTHTTSPSTLPNGELLKSLLTPETLGKKIHAKYNGDLPFLFKVLSIGKGLSIQAHPDKVLAKELHTKFPKIYKDDNHKPEMAIALTPFEAFIGFRQLAEISENLSNYPEFASLFSEATLTQFKTQASFPAATAVPAANKTALKQLFKELMTSKEDVISSAAENLVSRLKAKGDLKGIEELVVRLDGQFKGDVGIFCTFFLNFVKLESGQAIFLAANEPHAYLSGDCVECMAASDNVVRSGLTPKFKDVDTLVSMLTYTTLPPADQVLNGDPFATSKKTLTHTKLYNPPIEEFTILKTELHAPLYEYFDGLDGPSILIVTEGNGALEYGSESLELKEGDVVFIGAGEAVALAGKGGKAVFYRAYCEVL